MANVIAIANQKGGVGKTTTAVTLTAGLTKRGYKTLGIDMDPQGHLSSFMGADRGAEKMMYNVLRRECDMVDILQQTPNGIVAPANILLSGLEQELNSIGKEHRLRERLESIRDDFDYIVIDTSPALGVLTINALTAADYVLVPVEPDEGSIDGLMMLFDTVKSTKMYCNADLEILGVYFNVFNERRNLGRSLQIFTAELAEQLGTRVLETTVRRAEAVPNSRTSRVNIFDFDPGSNVAKDYEKLVDEIIALIHVDN